MGISLPGLALANQLYVAVRAQGHGRLGTHSLMLALERLNNIDRPILNPAPSVPVAQQQVPAATSSSLGSN
jgi:hypothetical protein